MDKFISIIGAFVGRIADEHLNDYREGRAFIYDGIVKTSSQINQIILTVSVASLAAVAALNRAVFVPYPKMSFTVVAIFIIVILLSVLNLYISTIVLRGIQKQFNNNWKSLSRLNKGMEKPRLVKTQKTLNVFVLVGFCIGLISLLLLLGLYILGGNL